MINSTGQCTFQRAVCIQAHNCSAGDYRSQFHVKAEKIAEALVEDKYDFGFLHIKAVDDTGHDQQPALKVSCPAVWPFILCIYVYNVCIYYMLLDMRCACVAAQYGL